MDTDGKIWTGHVDYYVTALDNESGEPSITCKINELPGDLIVFDQYEISDIKIIGDELNGK